MVMHRPWLHRFACLLVLMTFILVTSGGNVTSNDAGLAVPDGFWVNGYFLWSFPYHLWQGNIWHEHVHRLLGSGIGVICIVLLIMIFKSQSHRPRLKKLSVIVLIAVILQGVLGALRVEIEKYYPDTSLSYRVAHAISGQLFLCLTVLLAVATSRYWITRSEISKKYLRQNDHASRKVRTYRIGTMILFLVLVAQLCLGAVTRHSRENNTGLSIPDFPMSYGQIIPPLTTEGIMEAQLVMDDISADADGFGNEDYGKITPFQVGVHYLHRLWAVAVFFATMHITVKLIRLIAKDSERFDSLKAPTFGLLLMLFMQIILGVLIIYTGRKADVATAHQALGALMLAASFLLLIRVRLNQDYIYQCNAQSKDSDRLLNPMVSSEGVGA